MKNLRIKNLDEYKYIKDRLRDDQWPVSFNGIDVYKEFAVNMITKFETMRRKNNETPRI